MEICVENEINQKEKSQKKKITFNSPIIQY